MAATAKAVPDEARRWWETFISGFTVDQGEGEEEPELELDVGSDSDSDSGFERIVPPTAAAAEEEQNAASESDDKRMAAAQASFSDRHCNEEEVPGDCYGQVQCGLLIGRKRKRKRKRKATTTHAEPQATGTEIQDEKDHEEEVSADCHVQLQGGLLGRKRKAIATHGEPQTSGKEIQGEKCHGERLRAENEMLRQQLIRKTEELEAEKTRRLKLELNLKSKETKPLEKQNEEMRDKNECSRKRPQSHQETQGCPVMAAPGGTVPLLLNKDGGDDSDQVTDTL